jgi:hypothetical protein
LIHLSHNFNQLAIRKMHALSVWIESGERIHKRQYTFVNSDEFISRFVYPADLFVQWQRYADELDLDWDCEYRELNVFWMRERRVGQAEELHLGELREGEENLYLLSTAGLRETLEMMARREWNDVIYVRDITPVTLQMKKDYWLAMTGINHLDLRK